METKHCNAERSLPLFLVSLLFFLFSLHLSAAPKKDALPPVDPTVVYNRTVKVLRGGTCEVPLRAISPQGYDVQFVIIPGSGPRCGTISDPQRNSKSSVFYFYTHNGKKGASKDSFRIKAKSGPQKAWGYAKATILVEEPPPRFAVDVSSLDFGAVFLGESRTLPVRIKNAGGGKLQGRLKVGEPWRIVDPVDLTLAEGETKKVFVTFAPLSSDTQRGSLIFESGSKPFPEIALQGVGESRFEVIEKDSFEQRVGASELCIPIKNRTAAPLSISVQCPPPLKAPATIQLPPESSGELVLTLPAVPFAEKSVLITLGDGSATRDIRIQLPPPPSRLKWEVDGKAQLGEVTPGRTVSLTAKLQNTGSISATAVIRTSGDGFTLVSSEQSSCQIPPGGNVTINATWEFPETLGSANATLTAETDGLLPEQVTWEADIKPPFEEPVPTPVSVASPSPAPSPTIIAHGSAESAAIRKRLPTDISYQLEPHWNSFTAILTWEYAGLEPVEFSIVRPEVTRKNFLDKNPFQKRILLPSTVPTPVPKILWIPVASKKANITKLPDGRWQARVPGLTPGYHAIGIITKVAGGERDGFIEFPVSVGKISRPEFVPWSMFAIVLLCSGYLLRKKIRSMFG